MGDFSQEEFNRFVLDHQVVGLHVEPVRLRSGRLSHWYVNWRHVDDVYSLEELALHVCAFARDQYLVPDCFYGVPQGATRLGIVTQMVYAKQAHGYGPGSHVVPVGRERPKSHGARQDREFVTPPQGLTVVIEDVTTTGESLLTSIDQLLRAKIPVLAAIGLTNRMEVRKDGLSVSQAVDAAGVSYLSMSNSIELLPLVCDRQGASATLRSAIVAEFDQYGAGPILL